MISSLYNKLKKTKIPLILGLFIWIILHELIHGVMYYINGAKWKNIVFGVELEKGIFCCLCNEEITRKNILVSSISPCFLIGIVTYILGIIFHNMFLIIFSIMQGLSMIYYREEKQRLKESQEGKKRSVKANKYVEEWDDEA